MLVFSSWSQTDLKGNVHDTDQFNGEGTWIGLEKPYIPEDIHASRLSRVVAGCSTESWKTQRSSTD